MRSRYGETFVLAWLFQNLSRQAPALGCATWKGPAMKRTFPILLLMFSSVLAGQSVHLTVPALDSSNNAVTIGTAYFSWGQFTGNDGVTVQGGQLTRPIINGTIDVTLKASDTAGYVYTLLLMRGSTANTFVWRVPAAGATTMAQLNQPPASAAPASTAPKWVLAYSSGTQTVPGSFTGYNVLFDTNDPNTNDGSMHSTSSHSERFVAPADGFYAGACLVTSSTNGTNSTYVNVNMVHSTTTTPIGFSGDGSTQAAGFGFNTPFSYFLQAGDYVYCSIFSATGFTSNTGLAATRFYMHSLR